MTPLCCDDRRQDASNIPHEQGSTNAGAANIDSPMRDVPSEHHGKRPSLYGSLSFALASTLRKRLVSATRRIIDRVGEEVFLPAPSPPLPPTTIVTPPSPTLLDEPGEDEAAAQEEAAEALVMLNTGMSATSIASQLTEDLSEPDEDDTTLIELPETGSLPQRWKALFLDTDSDPTTLPCPYDMAPAFVLDDNDDQHISALRISPRKRRKRISIRRSPKKVPLPPPGALEIDPAFSPPNSPPSIPIPHPTELLNTGECQSEHPYSPGDASSIRRVSPGTLQACEALLSVMDADAALRDVPTQTGSEYETASMGRQVSPDTLEAGETLLLIALDGTAQQNDMPKSSTDGMEADNVSPDTANACEALLSLGDAHDRVVGGERHSNRVRSCVNHYPNFRVVNGRCLTMAEKPSEQVRTSTRVDGCAVYKSTVSTDPDPTMFLGRGMSSLSRIMFPVLPLCEAWPRSRAVASTPLESLIPPDVPDSALDTTIQKLEDAYISSMGQSTPTKPQIFELAAPSTPRSEQQHKRQLIPQVRRHSDVSQIKQLWENVAPRPLQPTYPQEEQMPHGWKREGKRPVQTASEERRDSVAAAQQSQRRGSDPGVRSRQGRLRRTSGRLESPREPWNGAIDAYTWTPPSATRRPKPGLLQLPPPMAQTETQVDNEVLQTSPTALRFGDPPDGPAMRLLKDKKRSPSSQVPPKPVTPDSPEIPKKRIESVYLAPTDSGHPRQGHIGGNWPHPTNVQRSERSSSDANTDPDSLYGLTDDESAKRTSAARKPSRSSSVGMRSQASARKSEKIEFAPMPEPTSTQTAATAPPEPGPYKPIDVYAKIRSRYRPGAPLSQTSLPTLDTQAEDPTYKVPTSMLQEDLAIHDSRVHERYFGPKPRMKPPRTEPLDQYENIAERVLHNLTHKVENASSGDDSLVFGEFMRPRATSAGSERSFGTLSTSSSERARVMSLKLKSESGRTVSG
ncbi:hypothetical protein BDY17DRAFT_118532 [Neohortaea acidophila]|uniref:Uncharacterized protein n=1 Tax=Neohortaea acidophila TaxID=245834 RepID=A0A6A6PXJ6_9PEZI|nr:uncharacterized protein BDY17DRAFT_118532 [Neohortaea acidophila]KAF2483957.1 hypothetical protein BDY17DRAFT_118532 [Neohortaea acidophila]